LAGLQAAGPIRQAVGVVCAAVSAALAQSPEPAWTMATPWTGPAGVVQSTEQIVAAGREYDARLTSDSRQASVHRPLLRGPDRRRLPNASVVWEDAASHRHVTAQDMSSSEPQAFGLTFMAAVYADAERNPPSPSGAVGPTQLLLAVNGRIRLFDKNTGGLGILDVSLNAFFNAVRNSAEVVDPRVRFDRLSQRWFVLASTLQTDGMGNLVAPNRILLAVSNGAIITGSTQWRLLSFEPHQVTPAGSADCIADFATLGIDAHALYIGVNQYCGIGTPGSYNGTAVFVVRKSSVLGIGPMVVSVFRDLTDGPSGSGPYSPQGADNLDADATEGYIIGVSNDSLGSLTLRRIQDPGGTPAISANIPLLLPADTFPPYLVPHLGNNAGANGYLNAMDDRLCAAHIRGGRLWTAHNINVNAAGKATSEPNRVGVRWYEVKDLSGTPTLASSGTIYDTAFANPLSYWTPSVMTSGRGRIAFGFSVAGSASYIDAAAMSLLPGGFLVSPNRFTAAAQPYNPTYDPGGADGRRWGEISQTTVDPVDDATLWTIQPFAAGTNAWGVQVAQILAPAPTLEPVAYHACNTQTEHVITLTGTNFFDARPTGNGPTVEFTGGDITVLSVDLLDDRHALVRFYLQPGAGWSYRTIIYTNPDGQSASLFESLIMHGGRADFTNDCVVNEDDFLMFLACSTGPGILYDVTNLPEGCVQELTISQHLPPDLDDDNDVDMDDFGIFQRCLTAPGFYISDAEECRWGI